MLWGSGDAEVTSEIAEVLLERGRVAEDEARQEPEQRVGDEAVLGDRDARAVAVGRDLVDPAAAERQAVVGDARDEAAGRAVGGRRLLVERERDHAVPRALAPAIGREHLDLGDPA